MPQEQGMGLSKKEIESHSSALFNKRINELWMLIDNAEMDCLNAMIPSVQNAMAYYAPLMTMFMETSRMYESNENISKPIEKCIKNGLILVTYLKGNNAKQWGVENLIKTCMQWRYLMQTGQHNMNYFLRMSFQEPKGIGEILKLFGGIDEIPGHSKQLPAKPKQEA